jgi:hypothetical protein
MDASKEVKINEITMDISVKLLIECLIVNAKSNSNRYAIHVV